MKMNFRTTRDLFFLGVAFELKQAFEPWVFSLAQRVGTESGGTGSWVPMDEIPGFGGLIFWGHIYNQWEFQGPPTINGTLFVSFPYYSHTIPVRNIWGFRSRQQHVRHKHLPPVVFEQKTKITQQKSPQHRDLWDHWICCFFFFLSPLRLISLMVNWWDDRWWQLKHFFFQHYLGKWSNLTIQYFLNGLVQPPTRVVWVGGLDSWIPSMKRIVARILNHQSKPSIYH